MGSVLIVMPRYEDANHIAGAVKESGLLLDIEICKSGADVLRTMHDRDYGVVICTKNLRDMGYIELAEYMPEFFGMIVLTKDISLETISEKMVKLILPFKKRELLSTIQMMINDFYHDLKRRKKKSPKRSTEESKIIDEAKAMLMERNGMTEPEAFRYIQKSSMDNGRSMVESAQMLLLLGGD